MKDKCKWKPEKPEWDFDGTYNTSCGELFTISEGTPTDNKMNYCCYCGKLILDCTSLESLRKCLYYDE